MRITPNLPRLRMVALICWLVGTWWIWKSAILGPGMLPPILSAAGIIVAAFAFAVGLAFWLLASDRQAGVVFDRKGLALNLGHSSAFVAWENISSLGVSRQRLSLLTLGSGAQLGICLKDPARYLQSYETRLPAASGLIGTAMSSIRRIGLGHRDVREPTLEDLATIRRLTGYDIVIPEAQLGGHAEVFITLVETYRASPEILQHNWALY